VSVKEAESCIIGYTIGNDLSCRVFQLPAQNGGQFFYAKAFDKFAPIGPVLISPEVFQQADGAKLTTRVNGEIMQDVEIGKDRVFSPAQILSFMSQSESSCLSTTEDWRSGASQTFGPSETDKPLYERFRHDHPGLYRGNDGHSSRSWRFQVAEAIPQ
jgi:hypothetical protein